MKKKCKNVIDIYIQPIFAIQKLIVVITSDTSTIKLNLESSDGNKLDFKNEDYSDYRGLVYYGYKYDGQNCVVVIINPTKDRTIADVRNTITHESFHAAHHILDYSDIKLTFDTEETFAYTTGWVAECVFNSYDKWKKQ